MVSFCDAQWLFFFIFGVLHIAQAKVVEDSPHFFIGESVEDLEEETNGVEFFVFRNFHFFPFT